MQKIPFEWPRPWSRRAFLGAAASAAFAARSAHGQAADLTQLTLLEAARLIREKEVSPVELTQACLDRIERLQPSLNAFITVTAEEALAQARLCEEDQQRGLWRGNLHGIPIGLKDLIDTAGIRTTGASELFNHRVPAEDAEVVRRLKQAGAVIIGKLNMDEFAYNFTSETSYFAAVHNPWDLRRTPGGSSGGSAAAVSAGMCFGALGSDTGGSIRQPAAFCGIVGLKPSYGLVSKRGALPLAWTLDHLGPMCRDVTDTAILLTAMAGYDAQDPSTVQGEPIDYAAKLLVNTFQLRVGVARKFFFEDADAEIVAAVDKAIEVVRGFTARVEEVEMPDHQDIPVLIAEAYAYHQETVRANPEQYHPLTRANVELGSPVTMPQYAQARLRLDALRRDVERVFERVDVIITPTTPRPPIFLEPNRVPDIVLLRNAIPMNLYDVPTVSVPCGFTSEGLPIGMQISGPRLSETLVLALAHVYEQSTEWHRRRPPLDA